MQVLQEARLVDGHQRAQAHGHRGELPELGHQLGVGVAGQALAVHFLAEVQQLVFGDAAFQVSAGIDAGRDVALDVQAVTAVVFALGVPEVVEAGTKQIGQRGKRADVAAQITAFGWVVAVGLDHHGHGVPAHIGAQTAFDDQVAGALGFLVGLQRVHVAGVGRERHVHAVFAGVFQQVFNQLVGVFGAFAVDDGGERIHPLTGFLAVELGLGVGAGLGVGLSCHGCLLVNGLQGHSGPQKSGGGLEGFRCKRC